MKVTIYRLFCVLGLLFNLSIMLLSPVGIVPRIITTWHNKHEAKIEAGENWNGYEDECCIVCGRQGEGKRIASTRGGSRIVVCKFHEGRVPTSMGLYLLFYFLFGYGALIGSIYLIWQLIKLPFLKRQSFLSWRLDDSMTLKSGIFTLIFGAFGLQIINWLMQFFYWAEPTIYLKILGIL